MKEPRADSSQRASLPFRSVQMTVDDRLGLWPDPHAGHFPARCPSGEFQRSSFAWSVTYHF